MRNRSRGQLNGSRHSIVVFRRNEVAKKVDGGLKFA